MQPSIPFLIDENVPESTRLLVEPFNHVGGAERLSLRSGEGEERKKLVAALDALVCREEERPHLAVALLPGLYAARPP